jgi:hypothetical protein
MGWENLFLAFAGTVFEDISAGNIAKLLKNN